MAGFKERVRVKMTIGVFLLGSRGKLPVAARAAKRYFKKVPARTVKRAVLARDLELQELMKCRNTFFNKQKFEQLPISLNWVSLNDFEPLQNARQFRGWVSVDE